jgi:hypothetical protein
MIRTSLLQHDRCRSIMLIHWHGTTSVGRLPGSCVGLHEAQNVSIRVRNIREPPHSGNRHFRKRDLLAGRCSLGEGFIERCNLSRGSEVRTHLAVFR